MVALATARMVDHQILVRQPTEVKEKDLMVRTKMMTSLAAT
jgi:hypothetical protein